MKKLSLIILVALLLPVTSSFAAGTGQQILIPYAQSGNGYWSGVAILNPSGEGSMTFTIGVYMSDAVWHPGEKSFTVEGHAIKVDLLDNFFGGSIEGRMSILIQTHTNVPFNATLFVGNDQGGFGLQNYESKSYTY
jgi:hypothetical protein